jgi:predicted ATPase
MLGNDTLDIEGRNLAALIKRIQIFEPMALNSMSRSVHRILPELKRIFIDEDQARQQYVLMVESVDGRLFSSNVLSEGTLRIISLIALNHDERHRGLICFEEPENGIHPYRMKKILGVLRSLTTDFNNDSDAELPLRQVFINTHSPLLIREISGNPEFKKCLIFFSRLVNKVDADKKVTYKLTRLSAVKNEDTKRLFLDSIPAEDSVTKHELMDYLNSSDSETSLNTSNS